MKIGLRAKRVMTKRTKHVFFLQASRKNNRKGKHTGANTMRMPAKNERKARVIGVKRIYVFERNIIKCPRNASMPTSWKRVQCYAFQRAPQNPKVRIREQYHSSSRPAFSIEAGFPINQTSILPSPPNTRFVFVAPKTRRNVAPGFF